MITQRVKVQLVVFSVMGMIACLMIFFHYTRMPSLLGFGQTKFSVDFPEGAGLYPHANVTYQGVTVGKVARMRLTDDGVVADLSVDSDAQVPKGVVASIRSVSAIGEQYVDLVPKAGSSDVAIADGDVVPIADTRVPISVARVLDDVDGLLGSIPRDSLDTVLAEAEQAFRGIGPDMARINTDAQALIASADENYSATHRLIADAEPVLDTQIRSSAELRSWLRDLNGFTAELSKHDRGIRELLADVPPAADRVTGVIADLNQIAPRLISSSDVTAHLLKAYYPSVEQVLSVYPLVSAADMASLRYEDGAQFRLSFKTIVNYPGGCAEGWPKAGQPYGYRPSTVITDSESAKNAYCRIRQDDPRVARGARNLQCFEPGSPPHRRAALVTQCRGAGYTADAEPFQDLLITNPLASSGNALLAPLNGASPLRSVSRPASWQALLLGVTQ